MQNKINGPWDMPLRGIISSLPITVFIYDLKNDDNVLHQIELDLSNPDDRKYIGKITAWAVTQHYSVETMAKSDAMGG